MEEQKAEEKQTGAVSIVTTISSVMNILEKLLGILYVIDISGKVFEDNDGDTCQPNLPARGREDAAANLSCSVTRVEILSGIIPMCAECKKIRNSREVWEEPEKFIQKHSGAKISHGICPACLKRLYPELYQELSNSPDGC